MLTRYIRQTGALAIGLLFITSSGAQEPSTDLVQIKLSKTGLTARVPANWAEQPPKSQMIEHEYAIKPSDESQPGIRITMMAAGGTPQANIDRWIGQFSQADTQVTKDKARVQQRQLAGREVHTVDIAGTFKDRPQGPFGPVEERAEYRMLGAIIVAKPASYFVKFYGPQELVSEHEQSFDYFLNSLTEPAE